MSNGLPYQSVPATIQNDLAHVTIQPRRKFSGIGVLCRNILQVGLLHPLTVALFTYNELKIFCKYVNRIRISGKGKKIKPSDFTSHSINKLLDDEQIVFSRDDDNDILKKHFGREKVYVVLLAGERRLRALKMGYRDHTNEYLQMFGGSIARARLLYDIDPFEAILIQTGENSHEEILPHEEAVEILEAWNLAQVKEPGITKVAFAERIGRSVSKINEALKFCQLPLKIQRMVRSERYPMFLYGHAIVLAKWRNRDSTIKDKELIELAKRTIICGWSVAELRRIVNQEAQQARDQVSMFDGEATEGEARRFLDHDYREVVGAKLRRGVGHFKDYWGQVNELLKDGLLGQEDSPYSDGAVIRDMRKLITLLDATADRTLELLPASAREEFKRAMAKAGIVLSVQEKRILRNARRREKRKEQKND